MTDQPISQMTDEIRDDHMRSIITNKDWTDIHCLSTPVRDTVCGRYQKPTLIQYMSIGETIEYIQPIITVKCRNGGGKTLTFAIPSIEFAYRNKDKPTSKQQQASQEKKGGAVSTSGVNVYCPTSIIVVATQPLAVQISDVINNIKPEGVKCEVLFSDQKIESIGQILISTPDLLQKYLVKDKLIQLDNLVHFAVDEADSMLTSFSMQIGQILSFLKGRDIVIQLVSATLSTKNVQLIFDSQKYDSNTDEDEVIYSVELPWKLKGVTQFYVDASKEQDIFKAKFEVCKNLINRVLEYNQEDDKRSSQVIIFFRKTQSIINFEDMVTREGIDWNFTTCSDKKSRNKNIQKFREGSFDIMLGSLVMSRGIDIRKVGLVINFELPVDFSSTQEFDKDTYLHNIGRTGRFADLGISVTFIDKQKDVPKVISEVKTNFECDILPYNGDQVMVELKSVMINNSQHERVQ